MTSTTARLAAGALALAALAACTAAHTTAAGSPSPAATFGGFPTFLPKNTLTGGDLHEIRDATAEVPVLATQGDTVRVHSNGATVLATLTGPEVPTEGLPLQSQVSPAQWTLTFSDASASVPLAASQFNAIDEDGKFYRPTAVAGTSIPTSVNPGQTVTFKLHTVIQVGEGRMRWIPAGHLSPVEWDFTIEND